MLIYIQAAVMEVQEPADDNPVLLYFLYTYSGLLQRGDIVPSLEIYLRTG